MIDHDLCACKLTAANFIHLLVSNKLFVDLLCVCSNLVSCYISLDLSCFQRKLQGVVFN